MTSIGQMRVEIDSQIRDENQATNEVNDEIRKEHNAITELQGSIEEIRGQLQTLLDQQDQIRMSGQNVSHEENLDEQAKIVQLQDEEKRAEKMIQMSQNRLQVLTKKGEIHQEKLEKLNQAKAQLEHASFKNALQIWQALDTKDGDGQQAQSSEKQKRDVHLWAYTGPLMVAGFKDFLDLALIGSFPGIGTVITICCNLLIFFLFLIGSGLTVRSKIAFLFRAGGALIFATGVEGFLFGLNVLPVGLGIIMGIYFREKKHASSIGA
ncbi:MAG: hypothetical protein KBC83_00115 [Candidatus Moranbacteria bacterium]|jgi:hypothetical protein|nr:hypothetical protein [Candidatus Moranbacteria bacterium]MBP9801062.1 hypothetical protein [Candidatus Moranbacteria bacterium]